MIQNLFRLCCWEPEYEMSGKYADCKKCGKRFIWSDQRKAWLFVGPSNMKQEAP